MTTIDTARAPPAADIILATGYRSVAALERAIMVEQVRMILQRIRATQWAMLVLAVAIAWVFRAAGAAIYVWLAMHVLLKLGEWIELRWFSADADIARDPAVMALRLTISQATHAAAWAALAPIVLPRAAPEEFILVFMIAAGIASGSVTAYAPLLRVFTAYIAVLTLILDIALVFGQTAIDSGYPTLFVTIYGAAMWEKARTEAAASRRSIVLTFTNQEFSRNLEREIARSETAEREAVDANMAKSKFLAAASHDLRQPLAALGLFLGVLEQGVRDEAQRAATAGARAAFVATTEMLDTLLDFSRAEAGVIVSRPQPFAVADAFARVERAIGPLADQGGLDYRTRASRMVLDADPGLVHIILLNLVSNAVRYTAHGGVLIGCRARGGDAVIEVWDSGIGIAADQLDDIFREFHQLGNLERDRRKGLGLGLAIARRLATVIGAELTVASRPGRGSVFRLRLPRALGLSDAPAGLVYPAPGRRPAPRTSRPRRVLVLDDDEAIGEGMRQLLGGWGYDGAIVQTIADALARIERWVPDAMVCDLRLRGAENGIDAIRQLRAQIGIDTPAIIMTGETDPDRLRDAARAALTVLHKPVVPDALQAALARILRAEPT